MPKAFLLKSVPYLYQWTSLPCKTTLCCSLGRRITFLFIHKLSKYTFMSIYCHKKRRHCFCKSLYKAGTPCKIYAREKRLQKTLQRNSQQRINKRKKLFSKAYSYQLQGSKGNSRLLSHQIHLWQVLIADKKPSMGLHTLIWVAREKNHNPPLKKTHTEHLAHVLPTESGSLESHSHIHQEQFPFVLPKNQKVQASMQLTATILQALSPGVAPLNSERSLLQRTHA